MRTILKTLAVCLAAGFFGTANAALLHIHDENGNLGTVDTATGATSVLFDTGGFLTDIAFRSDGALFGIDFNNLYSINLGTGIATIVGAHGIGSFNNSLVFGPDGTLYSANGTGLYSINPATGVGTLIGALGAGASSAGDLAFIGGVMYLSSNDSNANGSDELYSINPATGAATLIGEIGFADVFGLANVEGTLYGVSFEQLLAINIATGAGILAQNFAGPNFAQIFGTSFFAEAVIPAPPALILFGTALAAWRMSRRRKEALAAA